MGAAGREGDGQLPQQVRVTWRHFPHVSVGLQWPVCPENETVVQIECLPIRSWTQKSNTEADAGGEEGWSAVRAVVCVPASLLLPHPKLGCETLSVSFCS